MHYITCMYFNFAHTYSTTHQKTSRELRHMITHSHHHSSLLHYTPHNMHVTRSVMMTVNSAYNNTVML
jgi:hypothetical protein